MRLVTKEEITYKDLTYSELNKLKDLYIESRLKEMSEIDMKQFVKSIIQDQIKGTVGNQEEKEAWKEMKDHFKDSFTEQLRDIKKDNQGNEKLRLSPEEEEFNRRLEMVEKLKKDTEKNNADMWED